MEKYAAVKEKLKKLSAEQGRGDRYDPFLPPQSSHHNRHHYDRQQGADAFNDSFKQVSYGQTSYGQSTQTSEQLAIDNDPANHYSSQQTTSPVAKAIGTLQHRSHSEGHYSATSGTEASGDVARDWASFAESDGFENDPIAQEIHRLELRAIDINNRSQQQANDILDLKRAAQQAAIAFGRQGVHDHPQLDVINRFFERYAASHVPIIERDDCGHFILSDCTINLRRAEEEAIENAAVLRNKRRVEQDTANIGKARIGKAKTGKANTSLQMSAQPFVHPVNAAQDSKDAASASRLRRPKSSRPIRVIGRLSNSIGILSTWLTKSWRSLRIVQSRTASSSAISNAVDTSGTDILTTEQYIETYPRRQEFAFIDGAICFSSAAIVGRLALKTLVSLFPVFQPVLWLAPLVLFCTAIYLLFVVKSTNNTLMYRLVLVALGLFISSSL